MAVEPSVLYGATESSTICFIASSSAEIPNRQEATGCTVPSYDKNSDCDMGQNGSTGIHLVQKTKLKSEGQLVCENRSTVGVMDHCLHSPRLL